MHECTTLDEIFQFAQSSHLLIPCHNTFNHTVTVPPDQEAILIVFKDSSTTRQHNATVWKTYRDFSCQPKVT